MEGVLQNTKVLKRVRMTRKLILEGESKQRNNCGGATENRKRE